MPGRASVAALLLLVIGLLPSPLVVAIRPNIYILDLVATYAGPLGLPSCASSNITKKTYHEKRHGGLADGGQVEGMAPVFDLHKAQHSVEWWLWASLFHSAHRTYNIDKADLVLVHWWCYLRLGGSMKAGGAAWLARMWAEVTGSARYQLTSGADFVVITPHPFLGRIFCNTAAGMNPIQVIVEEHQVCRGGDRFILTPYLSLTKPRNALAPPDVPWQQWRPTLLTFTGLCTTTRASTMLQVSHAGKTLRKALVEELVPAADAATVLLRCLGGAVTPGISPNATLTEQVTEISRSAFCLVLSGETVSSRLVSEVVLGGCLPVLVGPPFHNLPLTQHVNYSRFALVFQHAAPHWQADGNYRDAFHCGLHPPRGHGDVVNVTSFKQVLDHIQGLNTSQVQAMQVAMGEYQRFFVPELFLRDLVRPKNMNDALLHTAVALAAAPAKPSPTAAGAVEEPHTC